MGPEGIILVNPPITTLQQSLTHSGVVGQPWIHGAHLRPLTCFRNFFQSATDWPIQHSGRSVVSKWPPPNSIFSLPKQEQFHHHHHPRNIQYS